MALTAEDIINRTENVPDTFTVQLSDTLGDVIVMRTIKDIRDVTRWKEHGKNLLALVTKGTCPPAWKPFLPITPEMAEIMAELTQWAITPTFDDLQALRFCVKNGALAAIVHTQIQQQITLNVTAHEVKELEAEKNDLKPIASGEPTSLSATNPVSRNTRMTSPNRTGHTPANS